MNIEQVLNTAYEGIVVEVQFPSGGVYHYKHTRAVEIGTMVVVPTKETMGLGIVVAVCDETVLNLDYPKAYKWIVQEVSFSEYEKLCEKDEKMLNFLKKEKRKNLRQQLLNSFENSGLDINQMLALGLEGSMEGVNEPVR